jgi:hypothetical protein
MNTESTPAPATNPFTKPVLTWPEFWKDMIGVTESTARKLSTGPDAPRFFTLGRKRFIRLDDALAWLETAAATRRYVPRKNNKGAAK